MFVIAMVAMDVRMPVHKVTRTTTASSKKHMIQTTLSLVLKTWTLAPKLATPNPLVLLLHSLTKSRPATYITATHQMRESVQVTLSVASHHVAPTASWAIIFARSGAITKTNGIAALTATKPIHATVVVAVGVRAP